MCEFRTSRHGLSFGFVVVMSAEATASGQAMKKPRMADELEDGSPDASSRFMSQTDKFAHAISTLAGFTVDKVLSMDTRVKSMAVCGSFAGDPTNRAVILAEKQPLTSDCFPTLFSASTKLECNLQNDIYGQYEAEACGGVGALRLTTVFPATDKHVQKYSDQEFFLVHETPKDFESITRPFIETQAFSKQVGQLK